MSATLSAGRIGRSWIVAVCVVFLLGVSGAVSTASAQSDAAAVAPWQAHPCEGQAVPPPSNACDCDDDGPCGVRLGRGRACGTICGDDPCGEGACDEECNVATDWLRMFQRRDQLEFRGEYIAWWTKGTTYPPLVSTGILDTAGTEILYSGNDGNQSVHSGGRFNLCYWFNPCREAAFDVTYTFLGSSENRFHADGSGGNYVLNPYFDVSPTHPNGQQDGYVVALPGSSSSVDVTNTQELNLLEAVVRCGVLRRCNQNLDFVFGYQYGHFGERLEINSIAQATIPNINKSDVFDARNEFNGFELGMVSTSRYCRWSLDTAAKFALGNTHSRVIVAGQTVAGANTYDGGVYALPSNSGIVERDTFSVIPQIGMTLGYDLTCRLKATFGYTLVYWSGVMRPADQIDTTLNGDRIPPGGTDGAALPQSKSVTTDFWAQGFNIGLDYRY
jgi:hypothetical protein